MNHSPEYRLLRQHIKGALKTLSKKNVINITNEVRSKLIDTITDGIFNQQFTDTLKRIDANTILKHTIEVQNNTINFLNQRISELKKNIPTQE